MKQAFLSLHLFSILIVLIGCGNENEKSIPTEEQEVITETPFIDDENAEETAADTSSTGVYQEEVVEEDTSLKNALKAEATTPVEEGMSFCDCVKKNKKLTDIMMDDNTSDADFDKAMADLEAMKTGECKIMFPDQNNIDEQAAHKRKVNNCLN